MKLAYMLILITMVPAAQVFSEEEHKAEVRFHVGAAAFLDESTPLDHHLFGASVRIYLTKTLAIEPEFNYLKGPGSNRDYLIYPNVVFDFAKVGRATFYLIGGAGLLHHRQKFPGAVDEQFSNNEWTLTYGVGLKVYLTDRFYTSGDFRLGLDPLIRISGGIGYAF